MRKVSSSTSISAKRIHSSFVERNRIVIGKTSGVNPVDPVPPVSNQTSYSSSNHLMASDQFYDKLEKLKKEYLNFYHNERNLKKAIDQIEANDIIDLKHIKNLIAKYNKTVLALENLDKRYQSKNISNIKMLLKEYSAPLYSIGIYRVRDKELDIIETKFKIALVDSKDNLDELLNPIKEFIIKLYRSLINIKEDDNTNWQYGYENSYEDEFVGKSGLILDSKT